MHLKLLALFLALTACGRSAPQTAEPHPPGELHAFCGSTCWNDSYCTGITACSKCGSGSCSCSGNTPVAFQ